MFFFHTRRVILQNLVGVSLPSQSTDMATELQAFLESWDQEEKDGEFHRLVSELQLWKSVQGLFQTDNNPVWTQNICRVFFYAQNQSLIQWSHGSVLCMCLQTCLMVVTWLSHDYYNASDWSYQKCRKRQWQKVENLPTRFCHATPCCTRSEQPHRFPCNQHFWSHRVMPHRARSEHSFRPTVTTTINRPCPKENKEVKKIKITGVIQCCLHDLSSSWLSLPIIHQRANWTDKVAKNGLTFAGHASVLLTIAN